MSNASAQCASDKLADDDAGSILVGEIDRAYDDQSHPTPSRSPTSFSRSSRSSSNV